METRLNKFLAARVGMARREADEAIEKGLVEVNGRPAVLGQHVRPEDEVRYRGELIPHEKTYTYLKFNKPVGYVCSRKAQGVAETIYALLPEKYRKLKTVGRLDKDTSGLLLLTDDGDTAFRLTHPKFMKYKVYIAALDRPLEPLHQQMIADFGVDLEDGKSRLDLEKLNDNRRIWQVGMSEGRNRQIRRTFAALGYEIVTLHRTQFDNLALGELKEGSYAELNKDEMRP